MQLVFRKAAAAAKRRCECCWKYQKWCFLLSRSWFATIVDHKALSLFRAAAAASMVVMSCVIVQSKVVEEEEEKIE